MFPRATGEANLHKNDRGDGNLKRDSALPDNPAEKAGGTHGLRRSRMAKQSGRASMKQAPERRKSALTSA